MLVAAERKVWKDATTADGLECAAQETLGFFGEKSHSLVSLAESEERFDFVAGAVWPAIQESVVSNMGAVFSPVISDVVHRRVGGCAIVGSVVGA